MKHGYGHSYGKMMGHGKMMGYGKKMGGSYEMSNVKKSDGKQVRAGRGTIRTPFNRSILRDVGRRR